MVDEEKLLQISVKSYLIVDSCNDQLDSIKLVMSNEQVHGMPYDIIS